MLPFAHPECPSGKRGYWSRRDAKHVARHVRKSTGGKLMAAYRCDDCSMFHIGHLPKVVVRGEATRDEIRRKDSAA